MSFVHLSWMVCEMGGKWLNSYYFVECCFKDLSKTALTPSAGVVEYTDCISTDG